MSGYDPLYHGLIQIELFCGAFAVGFLLTALPKFLATKGPNKTEFFSFLATYILLSIALLGRATHTSQFLFILFLLQLVRFGWSRIKTRKNTPPNPFYILPIGITQGILGALLIIYPIESLPLLGRKFLEQGMLISLVLGVGSFLGPRLMGVVDTTNAIVSFAKQATTEIIWFKNPRFIVAMLGVIIFASFILETGYDRNLGIYSRAAAVTYFFFYFGILKKPRSQSIIGPLVAGSLWSVILGLCLAAIFPQYEVAMLHILYMGGFGFLILSIGAQVITSHGQVPRFWHEYRKYALIVALLVALSIVLRVIASIQTDMYFNFLFISSCLFDFALILWGLGLFGYLASGNRNN